MKIEKFIKEWQERGIITPEQSGQMLQVVKSKNKEERSGKFIAAISTLGAILLGVGVILFIASNWQEMSKSLKIIVLTASTLGVYYLGYRFKYEKKNLPRVGSALIFLGALLYCATVTLIAQIYHTEANSHMLVLMWLVGILPLAYGFRSMPIAGLSSLFYFIWIGLYIFSGDRIDEELFLNLPAIYLIAGLLLFVVGNWHGMIPGLGKIAKIYRFFGAKVSLLAMFLLTFDLFSGSKYYDELDYADIEKGFMITIIMFALLTALGLFAYILRSRISGKTGTDVFLSSFGLVVLCFSMAVVYFPVDSDIYTIIYNLLFVVLIVMLFALGYYRAKIQLVNSGIFWVSVFIIARYFDFFWDLMPRALFFMAGGLILVIGGIIIERKRRKLKENFSHNNNIGTSDNIVG